MSNIPQNNQYFNLNNFASVSNSGVHKKSLLVDPSPKSKEETSLEQEHGIYIFNKNKSDKEKGGDNLNILVSLKKENHPESLSQQTIYENKTYSLTSNEQRKQNGLK